MMMTALRSSRSSQLARCAVAVSAFSALGAFPSRAFVPSYVSRRPGSPGLAPPPRPADASSVPHRGPLCAPARPLSSRRGYDYDPDEDPKDESFLRKAADRVKSFLPSRWFKSDEERRAELARKRARDEISGGISEALRGAPLPVRVMGSVIAPLLSRAASGLSEAVEEQRRTTEAMLGDARRLMVADGAVSDALGEPIEVGAPFSQSSSTASIDGKTSVRVQASFEVAGSRQRGVAMVIADGGGIRQLSVNAGGRTFNVDTSGRGRGGGGTAKRLGQNKQGDVIDAEIIDAEFTEKK